jgi:hypothetical protein
MRHNRYAEDMTAQTVRDTYLKLKNRSAPIFPYAGEWVWINPAYRRGCRMKKPRRSRRRYRRNCGFFRATFMQGSDIQSRMLCNDLPGSY